MEWEQRGEASATDKGALSTSRPTVSTMPQIVRIGYACPIHIVVSLLDLFLFYVYEFCLYVCPCILCMLDALGGLRTAPDP